MDSTIEILKSELGQAALDSGKMIGTAMIISLIVGGALGLILYLTSNKLFFKNNLANSFAGFVINIIRSLPFIILLVLLLPITKIIVGSNIGPEAATVPITIAAIAFFARLSEGAFNEVDSGVIEAAISSGASLRLILFDVLIVEAFPSLIRAITVNLVSLIGYSAMAGIVGGGGIGDLAIRYGYYRYETGVMIVTVLILLVLVQAIQITGDALATKLSRK
ncbi:D-methionine transport system permease protein [Clostridium saccharoperbutylacetonicum]|uniref:Putative D-methionine transport system permease protein MetI n=1 Tax=Clostridium saccharoperbutylacetonicum N1-4(HMT) TaxID=931276 RepID=M1MLQ5_9CLOT|nr:methionine ABC transporter permease [Clostridium saccharoperbutylacetonicum]AGF55706.1 putative D-methionine transport system permease protein MetI [Clostridium saccharoperbutylacetonicum N1-4(HMT)]NRT63565.1 D-methionine transport system permease protein [Clostridium saccharoperbutylacetonicum]NSB26928.1 D-methionine transport system permease protein [Clostridium saccharoperbutylacetonicum]NSB40412.1 D-methionine transport system permease protein [Clostridium saccharoperbutylacetonicum]